MNTIKPLLRYLANAACQMAQRQSRVMAVCYAQTLQHKDLCAEVTSNISSLVNINEGDVSSGAVKYIWKEQYISQIGVLVAFFSLKKREVFSFCDAFGAVLPVGESD